MVVSNFLSAGIWLFHSSVCRKMSSTYESASSMLASSLRAILQNLANAFIKPKGIRRNCLSPRSVWNSVRCLSSSLIGIFQNPLVKSILDMYLAYPNLLSTNSGLGIGSASKTVREFNLRKSMQYLSDPSGFLTITVGLAYCEVDGSIMPSLSIFRTSSLASCCKSKCSWILLQPELFIIYYIYVTHL